MESVVISEVYFFADAVFSLLDTPPPAVFPALTFCSVIAEFQVPL